jgi:hypothetical protein
MTLYEGIIVANLAVTGFLAYKYGQLRADIETLYEGTAMCMTKLGMTND